MEYISRDIEPLVKKAAKQFPALVITGARQTGKSTMVRHLFPRAEYITFDHLSLRNYAKSDPVAFLNDYSETQVILDEIQEVPELLSYIKIAIDENRKPGRFIITGSQQFSLMEGVQESLAGRTAVLELLTLSFNEVSTKIAKKKWYELAYRGFYPEIWARKNIDIDLWYSSYIKTFIDRDISTHLREKNIFNYVRLIELLAARVSQEINFSDFAKELGLDLKTIQTWVSFLIRSQIIFLIPPYYNNLGKRITKKAKLYFHDIGLVSSLTKHKTPDLVKNGPIAGAIYENLVISQIFKQNLAKGNKTNLFYFRENNGLEIDLIIDSPHKTLAIEVKASETPTKDHILGLKKFTELSNKELQCYLICPVSKSSKMMAVEIVNHRDFKWSSS